MEAQLHTHRHHHYCQSFLVLLLLTRPVTHSLTQPVASQCLNASMLQSLSSQHVIYRRTLHNQNMLLKLHPAQIFDILIRFLPSLPSSPISTSIRNNTIPSSSSSKNNYPFMVQAAQRVAATGETELFPWNATGGKSIP